jgi:hypothetical protein
MRQAGTPNRAKNTLLARIRREFPEYDPICEMIRIARDPKSSIELQANMHREVAQYLEPKRKAIEITGEDGGPLTHSLKVEFVGSVDDASTE